MGTTRSAPIVAFAIADEAETLDFAGPWQVFHSTDAVMDGGTAPFRLMTAAAKRGPIVTSGGLAIFPDMKFSEAIGSDIIVVGGQPETPGLLDWVRESHRHGATLISVCTGAFHFAAAGLLAGCPATTHHDYWDRFAAQYPGVSLVRGPRFVQAADNVYTAGGLTAGIDLALHVVGLRLGAQVADRTARYMEHRQSLEMRPHCERCNATLAVDADARICSYECTFCVECASALGRCPNCGGELVARPRRRRGDEV